MIHYLNAEMREREERRAEEARFSAEFDNDFAAPSPSTISRSTAARR